jgi:hypothetical protein
MRFYLIAPALALAFAAAQPTATLADDHHFGTRLNVPYDQWLTPDQIAQKLSEKGYKVTEIESDDGAYEVDMIDKNGVRIESHVHPATGELLPGYDD